MLKFISKYYEKDGQLYQHGYDKPVGWLCNGRYMMFDEGGKKYLVHRAVFLITNGFLPALIDHIDQDKLNNLPNNLRESNKSLNAINSGLMSNNTSGTKGVSWSKRGKRYNLGFFLELNDAVKARYKAEGIYY